MPISKAQLIKLHDNATITYQGQDAKFLGWDGVKCINHGKVRIGDSEGNPICKAFVKKFLQECSLNERTDEAYAEVEAALKVLARHANVMGNDGIIGDTLASVIGGEHRTIQQTFIREIKSGIEQYAEDNANFTDARNEAGVKWAKAVAEVGAKHALPYV